MNETVSTISADCRVFFGGDAAGVDSADGLAAMRVALPVLAGVGSECLLGGVAGPVEREGCLLFQRGSTIAGFAIASPEKGLELATGELYRRLFRATAGLHLYKICHYVPQINAFSRDLENYQHFCRGRSLAFEEKFGQGFQRVLPAASAVGSTVGPLAIGFLAGTATPRYFENPRQIPAFEYPPEYGPRSPSFSRALVVATESKRYTFISGTAAIRGHETVAQGDIGGQLRCTLENLESIGAAAGTTAALGAGSPGSRAFKVYLRHPSDLPYIQAELGRRLFRPGDTVSYLQTDLCRSALLVEIEATLVA